jgi:hypothetical protein
MHGFDNLGIENDCTWAVPIADEGGTRKPVAAAAAVATTAAADTTVAATSTTAAADAAAAPLVGWCRLPVPNFVVKAPMVSALEATI